MTQLTELWNAQKLKVKSTVKDPLESLYTRATQQATKILSVFEEDDEEEEEVLTVKTQQHTAVQAISPEDLQEVASTAVSYLGVIFAGGCAVAYISMFVQYKNALARHDKLTTLLNHPMARVASGDQVTRVAQQVQAMKEEEEAKSTNDAIQRLLALQAEKKSVSSSKKLF
jgi:hypothetical protein